MTRFLPGMGKLREPQTSTVMLRGNRLAMADPKQITVYDLDKQTMTSIDLEKKTYAVITFQEFRQAMEAVQRKMAKARSQGKDAPQFSFKVDVKESGQSKVMNGISAREFILRMAMELQNQQQAQPGGAMSMDSNMWMASDIAGYDQIRDFYIRMGQMMNWAPGTLNLSGLSAMQPGMGEGMAEMMKQMQKIKGVPVHSVTRMKGVGMMGAGPGASGGGGQGPDVGGAVADEARRTAEREAANETYRRSGGRLGGVAGAAAGGAVGGILGGFRKKKQEEKPAQAPPSQAPEQAAAQDSVLLEITTDYSNFSTAAVDATKFDVPAGFKQVEHDMKKALRDIEE